MAFKDVGGAREKPIEERVPAEGENARAFWNRVIKEIFELLGARSLGADAIIAELDAGNDAEAARRDQAWGLRLLVHKMRERVKRKHFFLSLVRAFSAAGARLH